MPEMVFSGGPADLHIEPLFIHPPHERVIMKRIAPILIILCTAVAVTVVSHAAESQDVLPGQGIDPGVCTELQNQIDNVVNISRSTATDAEKVAQLSQILAQSLAAMSKPSDKDGEMDRIVNQYKFLIQGLMTAALATAGSSGAIPGETKDELQKIKVLTSNYVAMAKILCPNLKLPDAVNTP